MLQSQLQQGPIWAQRCPAWKADVQRIDACVIDREGGSEQSHRPQCQTVTATSQWPRKRLRSEMCMFDGAQSAPRKQPGRGKPCRGGQVPLPPEVECDPASLQGSSPQASGQSRLEFRAADVP